MKVLVLDTIHGGAVLAEALLRNGDDVDAVDVYRGNTMSVEDAEKQGYDAVTAPVHLNPDCPLLSISAPHYTHHQMTAKLLKSCRAKLIEITGARGKTTAAAILAEILPGRVILHASTGTWLYPQKKLLFKKSITPASLLFAAAAAESENADWIIAEESLGVCGAGFGILTSDKDYAIAAGKKSALAAKLESLSACKTVLAPKSCRKEGWYAPEDIVRIEGYRFITESNGSFENTLAEIPAYRNALQTAAAAAVLLNLDVSPLAHFAGCEGRMMYTEIEGIPLLDNANSGTNPQTIRDAAAYLKTKTTKRPVLVTGEGAHAVCDGLDGAELKTVINEISPADIIYAAGKPFDELKTEALRRAKELDAAVLMCVKTWR
ncbi:MAG TPA: coenzyme F430 synthase [Methanocorpusculum sp.]|nr:coenzyme F430 synthase [Methanocorpusculum sp.]